MDSKEQANQDFDRFGVPFIRTPNHDCPACYYKRIHLPEEWKLYHPQAGKGLKPLRGTLATC